MMIKPGAKLSGLQPEILVGLMIVKEVFSKYAVEVIITEGTGGQHMVNSLHYVGQAFDIRSKNIADSSTKHSILVELKTCLGSNFDIILEGEGTDGEHFHIEFQPKDN